MNTKQEAEKTLMHMRETRHGRYAIAMEALLKELEAAEHRACSAEKVVEAAKECKKFAWYEGVFNQGMNVARVDNLIEKLSEYTSQEEV